MIKKALKTIIPESLLVHYRIIRHKLNYPRDFRYYQRELTCLERLRYDKISFREKTSSAIGASLEHGIRIIKEHTSIQGKRILIIGCGKGDEIHRWVKEKPSRIIALDYLDFSHHWENIRYPNVKITQADIRDCEIDEEVDLITSQAVLEHISGLESVFPKLIKPLKAGGYFWSAFGPLYYTLGGAHAPLDYDHLTLSEEEYLRKLNGTEYEEARLFWKNNLFSKLTHEQYMSIFDEYLNAQYIGLHFSEYALQYRKNNRVEYNDLLSKHNELDLLLKGIYYLGRNKVVKEHPFPLSLKSEQHYWHD